MMAILLVLLLGLTGFKVAREIISRIKQWRMNKYSKDYDSHEERSENEGENCNCTLCYVNIRTIIFKPCRHYAVCKYCFEQLAPNPSCPFCKTPIKGII